MDEGLSLMIIIGEYEYGWYTKCVVEEMLLDVGRLWLEERNGEELCV